MRKKIRFISYFLLMLGFIIQPTLADSKLLSGTPPVSPTAGAQQNAVFLPGLSGTSALTIPSMSSKITGYPFTIEMWVRPNTITPYGGFFYDKGATKTSLQFANATTGEMRFDLFGGANTVPLTSATKLAVGKWQHIAVVVTSDSALVEIEGSFFGAAHTKVFAGFGATTSTLGLDVDAAARMFNGSIDEVRIWNSARTRDQIRIYKDSVLTPANNANLVAYYNFNDGSTNDLTANALNLTKGASATLTNANTDARISSISNSIGFLTPAFHPDSLTYAFYAPHASLLKATNLNDGSVVTGAPVTPSVTNPDVTITGTSKDGLSTKSYLVKTSFMPVSTWNGGTSTGASSTPSLWGWDIAAPNGAITWNVLNTSPGIRYVDNLTTYKNEDNSSWTGRAMYIRWDGSGAAPNTSYYNYPMYLEGGKTYHMAAKLGWNSNSSGTSVYTYSINSAKDNTGYSLGSKTLSILSTNMMKLYNVGMDVTPKTSGVYYLTITNNLPMLGLLANLTVAESTTPSIHSNMANIAFTEIKKSNTFTVGGSLLTDTIKLTAPVGITLSKNFLLPAEAATGFDITATYNYQAPILNGKIAMTSGIYTDTVNFTYTPPKISVFEQDVEVENNGKVYPLVVTSVGNSVDSLYVTASAGLTLAKSAYSNADFVAGAGSIKVNVSSTVSGTIGTLLFSSKKNVPASNLDTVNVIAVAPYVRYYIKHKTSGMVMGSHTTGLYPALTNAQELVTQKFILRRSNPLSLTDTSYYLLQDTAYRAVRKVASSGWDTEFGVPSNEAKWTIQQRGGGIVSLTNVATTKALGSDALTLDSRLYDDKTFTSNATVKPFCEWSIMTIPVLTTSSKTIAPMVATVTTPSTKTLKVGGLNLVGNIKVVLSGANANQFKVSFDSLVPVLGSVSDSTLTITYSPTVGDVNQTAILTISTPYLPSVAYTLIGNTDFTSKIVNPTIEAASNSVVPAGWIVDKSFGNTYTATGQHYSLVNSNRYLDSWNGTVGKMIYNAKQTIKDIPSGFYTLKAAARTSGSGSYIFLNGKQTEIINNGGAGGALGNGWSIITVPNVLVSDSMTIGAKTTVGWTGTWFSVDDFTLTYSGGDSASYKKVLNEMIANARSFDLKTSPNGIDTMLLDSIEVAEKATNVASMLSGMNSVNNALVVAKASVAPYAAFKALIDKGTLLSAKAWSGLALFTPALTAANAIYNGPLTLTADLPAAVDALKMAIYKYQVTQPAPADFTFVLANPSFEEGFTPGVDPATTKPSVGGAVTPIGWNVLANIDLTATGLNLNSTSGASMADGNWGYETWAPATKFISANVSQKIVAPTAGYYSLSAVLRCDASSPSSTDPLKFDGHLYAKVGNASEINSIKLAQAPGLITTTGWNTKAAWRTLTLLFKANTGDTIKLGAASTSFMQMDNFTLTYIGSNNPATIDVAYITFQKTMDATADSVQADPVYRMLAKDTLLNVTLKVLTDVSATATFDMSPYDAMIIQEPISSTAAILKPSGALALSKLAVPTLINKTYTFKAGGAFLTGAAGAGAEAPLGTYAIKVNPSNQSNPLFRGLTFEADTVQLFNAGATDLGAAGTKALNASNGVIGAEGTLLAYPLGMTPAIAINDIQAGDTIGGQITKSRMITLCMNFGALCRAHGLNMRNANYTLWRNAVYSLVGLTIPNTPMQVVTDPIPVNLEDVNSASVAVNPNPTTDFINISNLKLNSTVKIFNMTGQQMFNGKADSEIMMVDLSKYSNGMYMLQVVSNGKAQKSKIIKK